MTLMRSVSILVGSLFGFSLLVGCSAPQMSEEEGSTTSHLDDDSTPGQCQVTEVDGVTPILDLNVGGRTCTIRCFETAGAKLKADGLPAGTNIGTLVKCAWDGEKVLADVSVPGDAAAAATPAPAPVADPAPVAVPAPPPAIDIAACFIIGSNGTTLLNGNVITQDDCQTSCNGVAVFDAVTCTWGDAVLPVTQ